MGLCGNLSEITPWSLLTPNTGESCQAQLALMRVVLEISTTLKHGLACIADSEHTAGIHGLHNSY